MLFNFTRTIPAPANHPEVVVGTEKGVMAAAAGMVAEAMVAVMATMEMRIPSNLKIFVWTKYIFKV